MVIPVGLSFQLDTRAIGEVFNGFGKALLQILLKEGKTIAAGSAGMTLVEVVPLVGDNGEGGVLVIMERTEPDVLPTLGLQHDMLAYECCKISLIAHSVYVHLVKKHDVSRPAPVLATHLQWGQVVLESSLKSLPHEGWARSTPNNEPDT